MSEQARPVRADWRDRRDRPMVVPGELFSIYQPVIGPRATLAWLNLAHALQEVGVVPDPLRELEMRQGLDGEAAVQALAALQDAQLLEVAPDGGLILREPRSRGELAAGGWPPAPRHRGEEPPRLRPVEHPGEAGEPGQPFAPSAARSGPGSLAWVQGEAPPAQGSAPQAAAREALQAVVEFYHQRIGLLGPVQYEKLRFWVEEKQMSPDVVAAAIEETAASAEHPRIQYLEGILRNWYNDGIRTLQDLLSRHQGLSVLGAAAAGQGKGAAGGGPQRSAGRGNRRDGGKSAAPADSASSEGLPNATAYRTVTPEQIRRWKALHPEEYGDG